MRIRISIVILSLLSTCGWALAQLNPNSTANDVLNALHDSGSTIKSFSADVKLDESDLATGAEVDRFGKVWFQIKSDGEPVMHILFDHKQVGTKTVPDKIEYLLDDGWVTNRTFATTTESRIQLVPKGEKVNLFQLGKSPFPMPIGQDPVEIQRQFDVSTVPPVKNDPANSIHLLLKPKPQGPMANRFSSVDIWTDLSTKMPVKIETVDPKQVKDRAAELTNMKVNPTLEQSDVTLPELQAGWKTSDTPLRNQ